jgi:hypothetical protein
VTTAYGDQRYGVGIVAKWQLSRHGDEDGDARQALLDGRLDDAWRGFAAGEGARARVGVGDVLLARGDLAGAAGAYQQAIGLAPDDPLPWLGLQHAKMLAGEARLAATELEHLVAGRPDDAAGRYYLAYAWYLAVAQGCGRAEDGEVAIRDAAQAELVRHAATRILRLGAGDPAMEAAAARWHADVAAAERWRWNRTGAALVGALPAAAGLALVVLGGLTDRLVLVVAAAAAGAVAILATTLAYRRQAWGQ